MNRLLRIADLHFDVRGEVDDRAIEQLVRCTEEGDALGAALCADGHVGYSQPIGGVVAYRNHISPSGVGYDIGCGNKAVKTNLLGSDLHTYTPEIMDEIVSRISFGMGRNNNEPIDHPILDKISNANFEPQRELIKSATDQLGTVGSGNHYVDLFRDEEDYIWVGVHFGSRGFGHKTASGFLALSQGKQFNEKSKEGEMDSYPVLFRTDSELGQSYIEAMTLAGEYAYAGRDIVVNKVLELLQCESIEEVHNHHNFAWLEEHQGEKVWVVRKGCTPAWPGQKGFVGATMQEPSVILEGIDSPAMDKLYHSTVHGAGRVMSRTQAAGKKKWKFTCCNRDCDFVQKPKTPKPVVCPKCGNNKFRKIPVQVEKGKIDYDIVRSNLFSEGIEIRGGAADEAPEAYKRLDAVLDYHKDTINILHILYPIGVAMAGPDIHDPFKD